MGAGRPAGRLHAQTALGPAGERLTAAAAPRATSRGAGRLNSMSRIVLIALFVLLLVTPVAEGFPGGNGRIAYGWSTLDEPELGPFRYGEAIRTIKPGGGASAVLRRCVRSPGVPDVGDCAPSGYADPSWSPDGTRIVFDAGSALGLLDADGRMLRLIAGDGRTLTLRPRLGFHAGEPVFSPTGSRIAFTASPTDDDGTVDRGARELWVSDVYGREPRRVASGGSSPSWSPRGVIAFARGGQLWSARPDGGGLRRLTGKGGTRPAYSPHGSKIAFLRRGVVHVMGADGRGLKALRALRDVEQVRWSPDGRRLLVERAEAGIEIANADGSGARMIVADANGATYNHAVRGVDWQPLR